MLEATIPKLIVSNQSKSLFSEEKLSFSLLMFAERPSPAHTWSSIEVNFSSPAYGLIRNRRIGTLPSRTPPSPTRRPTGYLGPFSTHPSLYMLTFSQPQVAPEPDSEPDSPDLIPHFSLTDPFSTTVNQMDETIDIQLSNDPEFSMVIPRRNLAESEVFEILKTAIIAVLQAKEAQTKRVFEEMDSELKSREKDLIGEGYEKGLRSAYLMSTTFQGEALADSHPVKEQPGIPKVIIDYLANRTRTRTPLRKTIVGTSQNLKVSTVFSQQWTEI
jgi:hypothetical protein